MSNAACFDIGGTFIKYGIIDASGKILFKSKFPTPKNNCRVSIPQAISGRVSELKKGYTFDRVGISTAGQVDSDAGKIIFASDNLPDFTGCELSKDVKALTGLDCLIENDVNAAALGEMWKGGSEQDTFLFLALGTGIGGAIIINGKLYKGIGGAGEAGHIIINENGEACTCGGRGCYERYASTSAFIRNYCRISGESENDINGEVLMARVEKGEPLALQVYNEFIGHIATGLVSLVTLLDPGLVIIGGGISAKGEGFINDINRVFTAKAMPSYSSHTKIAPASLQNDAGLIGACYAAYNY